MQIDVQDYTAFKKVKYKKLIYICPQGIFMACPYSRYLCLFLIHSIKCSVKASKMPLSVVNGTKAFTVKRIIRRPFEL